MPRTLELSIGCWNWAVQLQQTSKGAHNTPLKLLFRGLNRHEICLEDGFECRRQNTEQYEACCKGRWAIEMLDSPGLTGYQKYSWDEVD